MDKAHLMKATWSDKDLLYEWANEPVTRQNSIHTDRIEYEEHLVWLGMKLKDKDCDLYLYYFGEIPIGQLRFDYEGDCGWISYSIDSRYRGQGHGSMLLKLAEQEVKDNRPEIRCLAGIVKKDNLASQKKFEELNYEKTVLTDHNLIKYQKNMQNVRQV
jgi:RimJ/RimL family protein N-acetyltransferase